LQDSAGGSDSAVDVGAWSTQGSLRLAKVHSQFSARLHEITVSNEAGVDLKNSFPNFNRATIAFSSRKEITCS